MDAIRLSLVLLTSTQFPHLSSGTCILIQLMGLHWPTHGQCSALVLGICGDVQAMLTMLLPLPSPPSVVCVVQLKHWWCQSDPMLGDICYEADLKTPWLRALSYDSDLRRFSVHWESL